MQINTLFKECEKKIINLFCFSTDLLVNTKLTFLRYYLKNKLLSKNMPQKRQKFKKLPVELVADYFIWKANKESKPITNKKLQKLLYYSQAWNVVVNDSPLFKDKIEAWVHGPAVKSIYLAYKQFGYEPISKKVNEEDVDKISSDIKNFLDRIWKIYGKFDAHYLELLTHNEKPWQEAREGLNSSETSDREISLSTMKNYYSTLLKD
jgi:uncharacterized phage-associated protein